MLSEAIYRRRWQVAIYSIAVGLPLLAAAVLYALAILGFLSVKAAHEATQSASLGMLVFRVVFYDWPFLVLSRQITKRIRLHWPNVSRVRWASVGALAGLSLPYVFGYFAIVADGMQGHGDDGSGESIYFAAVGWIGGGLLALIGWWMGIGALHVRNERLLLDRRIRQSAIGWNCG